MMDDVTDAVDVTDEVEIPPFSPYFVAHGYDTDCGKFAVFSYECIDGDDGYRSKEDAFNAAKVFCPTNSIRVFQLCGDPKPVAIDWARVWREAKELCDEGDLAEYGMEAMEHCINRQLKGSSDGKETKA